MAEVYIRMLMEDGSKIVFESDSTNFHSSSGSQIFLWSFDANGGGSLDVITSGSGNSYNPSIDDAGKYVVFDSFASFTNDLNTTNGFRHQWAKGYFSHGC